jgi:hypothetical protein
MTVKVVLYKIVHSVSTVTLRMKALQKRPTRPRRRGVTSIDALGYFQAGQEPTLLADWLCRGSERKVG